MTHLVINKTKLYIKFKLGHNTSSFKNQVKFALSIHKANTLYLTLARRPLATSIISIFGQLIFIDLSAGFRKKKHGYSEYTKYCTL